VTGESEHDELGMFLHGVTAREGGIGEPETDSDPDVGDVADELAAAVSLNEVLLVSRIVQVDGNAC